jgi:hypothetical protein
MIDFKTLWQKRPFQMSEEELNEFERVQSTGKWKEFIKKQDKRIKWEIRVGRIRALKLLKEIDNE